MKKAFSLIELSIVILIIGILVAGVTQSSRLVTQFRLNTARTLTQSSPVNSIKDLNLWFESTSEKSLATGTTSFTDVATPEDGDTIGRWNNLNLQRSFTSADLPSQATANRQPAYTASGINGLPALKFDGVNDTMPISNLSVLGPLSSFTIFFVATTPPSGTGSYNVLRGNNAFVAGFGTSYKCARFAATSGGWNGNWDPTGGVAIAADTPSLCTIVFNSTGVSASLNGGTFDTATAVASGTLATPTNINVGSSNGGSEFLNGKLGELIVFDRALKTEEREAVEDYLAKKWGIKLS